MSLLFETIRIDDGILRNISYHNLRMEESQRAIYNVAGTVNLEDSLQVPPEFGKGTVKCRVVYGKQIEEVAFSTYITRNIRTLKLVDGNRIDYSFKFTDREQLNALLKQRQDCDEILIVKDGYITDTSFSNIVFRYGDNWVTPANPLMRGTIRASLLHQRIIKQEVIRVDDLGKYSAARLINAMLPFGSGPDIPVDAISCL